jgi:hypothetical protein
VVSLGTDLVQVVQVAELLGLLAAVLGLLYLVTWLRRPPGPARHRRRSLSALSAHTWTASASVQPEGCG